MGDGRRLTIDDVLTQIGAELQLSRETAHELLAEIRDHLEDAVADARDQGQDEQVALLKAAEQFGAADVGKALQAVHAPWESTEALLACILPVVAGLALRWLVFAADGSVLGWPQLLNRPVFWLVALTTLLLPWFYLRRWHFALAGWGFFWLLTVLFMTLPNIQNW